MLAIGRTKLATDYIKTDKTTARELMRKAQEKKALERQIQLARVIDLGLYVAVGGLIVAAIVVAYFFLDFNAMLGLLG